jgi:site-specific DNA recombinase
MTRGREYLRVSVDKSGQEHSQDEQHAENTQAAGQHGIALGGPYRERGSASASRYATKAREAFDALLADLESGAFDADTLILWESSRGSRRVGEWVTLIDLCEEAGVTILVTTHRRLYDPSVPRDRRSLLEDAVDSEYESAKTSQRSHRAVAAAVAAGRPTGSAPFGYRRRYDERTRRLAEQEIDPDTAPVVREVFDRLLKGHAFMAIARDLEARGIRRRSGKPFSGSILRDMARRASYAGLRTHKGQITGDGTWPAIVPRETFYGVQAMLDRPDRKTARPGRGVHLLSMIARCHECGAPLVVTFRARHGRPEYQCRVGHVRVNKAELDEHAEAVMLGYLERPDVYEALRQRKGDGGGEVDRVQAELAEVRAELAALRAAVGARRLSVASLVAAEPGLLAREEELVARERSLSTPPALAGQLAPGADVRRRWAVAPMSARRDVARLLLSAEMLGEFRVRRRGDGERGNVRVAAEDRVIWRRGGEEL